MSLLRTHLPRYFHPYQCILTAKYRLLGQPQQLLHPLLLPLPLQIQRNHYSSSTSTSDNLVAEEPVAKFKKRKKKQTPTEEEETPSEPEPAPPQKKKMGRPRKHPLGGEQESSKSKGKSPGVDGAGVREIGKPKSPEISRPTDIVWPAPPEAVEAARRFIREWLVGMNIYIYRTSF